ncbi:conserved exported protein of unknown function [Rhodovastum atsumiense]|uniref:Gluconate 2-dehydrogenase subunit 3 family protein n=1 Tax=Rhodovastum atsumiense TaxID=504468 RepID=A0A5M6IKM9_9PROT|nr:hypothetical protein [Rhodovastum atsumiense]KAA5608467.1 hypothetical protein F1189_28925 [Rhodovastum atsumiense]CAH2599659.1 conserved exported protein of unknown function [Rhodovastum atsumiense]
MPDPGPARLLPRRVVALAAGLLLTACGAVTSGTVDTPFVPPAALGTNLDADQAAAGIAGWAFASPANTRGRPVEAARAVIAMEYLSGLLSGSAPYPNVSPLVQQQLLAGRQEVRRTLGVPPDAPSQAVVDAMIRVQNGLFTGDLAAATMALQPPLFGFGPQATLQILANLPPLPQANVATQRAQFDLQPGGGRCWGC